MNYLTILYITIPLIISAILQFLISKRILNKANFISLLISNVLTLGFLIKTSEEKSIVLVLIFLLFSQLLYFITMQDIKDREISTLALTALVLLGIAVNISIQLFTPNSSQNFISLWRPDIIFHPISNILSGTFWAAIFGIIVILTKRKGMGTADIFLAGFMGLSLGWTKSVIAFYLTIFLGLSYGLVKSIRLNKFKQVELPLVPFFSLSIAVSFIFGHEILGFIELLSSNISLF